VKADAAVANRCAAPLYDAASALMPLLQWVIAALQDVWLLSHVLHHQTALHIKGALLFKKGVIVTSVPHHPKR
jgi:hypothetical protein